MSSTELPRLAHGSWVGEQQQRPRESTGTWKMGDEAFSHNLRQNAAVMGLVNVGKGPLGNELK